MTTNPLDLLDKAIHRGENRAPSDESTPASVLDALEWSEDDSGQELVERAESVESVPDEGAVTEGSDRAL